MTHRTLLEPVEPRKPIDISKPIIVTGPAKITALEAAELQLLKPDKDIENKYLNLSPALRIALRDRYFDLQESNGWLILILGWFDDNPTAWAAFERSMEDD